MSGTCRRSVVFSGYSGFFTNKTVRQVITRILLKVTFNSITHPLHGKLELDLLSSLMYVFWRMYEVKQVHVLKHCYIQFHCDEFLSLSLYSGIKIVATKCIQIASDCRYERTYQHAPEELHNRKVMNIKHVMHHKVVCNNNNILQILPYMLNLMPL